MGYFMRTWPASKVITIIIDNSLQPIYSFEIIDLFSVSSYSETCVWGDTSIQWNLCLGGHLHTVKPVFGGHLHTVKPVLRGHLNLLIESVPTWQVSLHHRYLSTEKIVHGHNKVSSHHSVCWTQILLCM